MKNDRAVGHIKEAIKQINISIDKPEELEAIGTNIYTLNQMKAYLEYILNQLITDNLPDKDTRQEMRSMTRVIVDNWAINSELGSQIIKAVHSYIEAK